MYFSLISKKGDKDFYRFLKRGKRTFFEIEKGGQGLFLEIANGGPRTSFHFGKGVDMLRHWELMIVTGRDSAG